MINAIAPPATLRGSISGMMAKNGPYGAYMAAPAITSSVYEAQKWFAPTAQEPMKAKAAISSSGQTNSLRFCSLSDAQETIIIAMVAAR